MNWLNKVLLFIMAMVELDTVPVLSLYIFQIQLANLQRAC